MWRRLAEDLFSDLGAIIDANSDLDGHFEFCYCRWYDEQYHFAGRKRHGHAVLTRAAVRVHGRSGVGKHRIFSDYDSDLDASTGSPFLRATPGCKASIYRSSMKSSQGRIDGERRC